MADNMFSGLSASELTGQPREETRITVTATFGDDSLIKGCYLDMTPRKDHGAPGSFTVARGTMPKDEYWHKMHRVVQKLNAELPVGGIPHNLAGGENGTIDSIPPERAAAIAKSILGLMREEQMVTPEQVESMCRSLDTMDRAMKPLKDTVVAKGRGQ